MASANKVSRWLVLLLRHKPELAGLRPDAEGWVPVPAALAAVRGRHGPFTVAQLAELVAANDKQRLQMSPCGNRIRAAQGHTFAVELGLEQLTPPPVLYHGTKVTALAGIWARGLLPMQRHHVHLSATLPAARAVARRRQGASAVLAVDAAQGGPYYRSANGVWLADAVPAAQLTVHEYLD